MDHSGYFSTVGPGQRWIQYSIGTGMSPRAFDWLVTIRKLGRSILCPDDTKSIDALV
jgi:hypothetical protein